MRYGRWFVSFLLVVGGLLGLLGAVMMAVQAFHQHQNSRLVSGVLGGALFAWSIMAGIDLWRDRPRGFKWAKILFALQVPIFSLGHFVYEFSTLLSIRVEIGNTTHHVAADIGSSSNIFWLPQPPGFLLGVNVVAVAVLVFLRHYRWVAGSGRM
jgi:uncharacterized membrane protein (UPF0136 family)